ncbi:alpha-D-ribose 1-methylphosphonate 5-triphosphate diphosphatase [Shimia marina]|uniref:Alpha-D-ribose 1-methylphosphonate 5-triphosphate diphosphatase n=1 Tax=Shimia marina TaxID=321267 RepID=A0A0N7LS11_9RHOB|nr:alpha-D-ribose 1-methylphosphonate 5-triphosphate diphosphatase [Shimia marina]CUH52324.1 Alpha-D-ribose 1-methylphosphonate 5-triphosphate diphosphatase [Shimia marina]SFE08727.1 alpha-D-ribose 1-methylphosphonate 5-triphosphate diphosphatase [Shimia marina]
MTDLELVGAEVLRPEGMVQGPLLVKDGVIAAAGRGRQVDLSGYRILPGIVDLHGDGFERHLAPRRGAMKNLGDGLASVDAELAANGITTAVLAQFWSWEGGMRSPEFARRFLDALSQTEGLLTEMLVQLRFESHLLSDYAAFEAAVQAHAVPYVVFNDHLPHAALDKGKKPPRLTGQALKSGRSPEAHLALLKELHAARDAVPEAVAKLATRLAAQDVRLGSHDDDTAQARDFWRARGLTISEFPESLDAARSAHAAGDPVIMGAPNVVRGGSHSGKVSAADLVAKGYVDALASDYHYPAPRQAVMRLVADGVCDLAAAWALVSARPAQVLGLTDRGSLEAGKRADLVVMGPDGRIGATLVAGKVSHMSGTVAARFMAG